jgi:hypothetical protein
MIVSPPTSQNWKKIPKVSFLNLSRINFHLLYLSKMWEKKRMSKFGFVTKFGVNIVDIYITTHLHPKFFELFTNI